jgi:hypothetical protein
MTVHSSCLLKTIKFLKRLNNRNVFWIDEALSCRMNQLGTEHAKTQEYQELSGNYSQSLDRIRDLDDPERRITALLELDSRIGEMMSETETFYYLAGFNDAKQVVKIF